MFCYFGMLPTIMHDSALRDITGKAVNPKLNGMSAKGRSSSITPLLYIHCRQLTSLCMRGKLIGLVSCYQSNPGPAHWKAVKRILRYLKGTVDYTLCYQRSDLHLVGYCDAD
ncbi:hypothetical protein CsSME_00048885 [Camellia sinensis var. sinensis]